MEIRIYCEVFEQGKFFRDIINKNFSGIISKINVISTYGGGIKKYEQTSIVSLLRELKDFDLMVTIVEENKEFPLFVSEFSTAVQTDDHEFQRGDLLYWIGHMKIPYLKISAYGRKSPTAGDNHGGGSHITAEDQRRICFINGGVFDYVNWELDLTQRFTVNHEDYPSCPKNTREIESYLESLLNVYIKSTDYTSYLNTLRTVEAKSLMISEGQEETIKKELEKLILKFNISSRIDYSFEKKTLEIKINRYGHAMDPDRGMLAFWRSVLPEWKIIAKFHVQRESMSGRNSYKSCYEQTPVWDNVENRQHLSELGIKTFWTDDDFLNVHSKATRSTNLEFIPQENNVYKYDDDSLTSYLKNGKLFSNYKSILAYVDEVYLLDKNKERTLTLIWNKKIVRDHFSIEERLSDMPYIKLPLKKPTFSKLTEDYVTYLTKVFLEKNSFNIVAISYPGAQGDKPVLYSTPGTSVKRFYIDLIAYSEKEKTLLLIESKQLLSQSLSDIKKMRGMMENHKEELFILLNNLGVKEEAVDRIYIGVAAKEPRIYQELKDIDFTVLINRDEEVYSKHAIFNCPNLGVNIGLYMVE